MQSEYEQLKLENQLCFPLYAAGRKIVSRYTSYLKPLGITYTQYIVFMVLWAEDGIKVSDLCRKLYLDNGTVTPLLKKMEAEGYIKRVRESKDERVVTVRLTEKGWAMRESVKDIPMAVGSGVKLSEEDAVELYRLLYRALEVL